MRRYFLKTDKAGTPVASAEAMKLWKTDEGRSSLKNNRSLGHA